MRLIKKTIRALLRKAGYELKPYCPPQIWEKADKSGLDVLEHFKFGRNVIEDAAYFLDGIDEPLFFDVGANVGQTLEELKAEFPESHIHAFEPSPSTYSVLSKKASQMRGVTTWNCGVGSKRGVLPFQENKSSDMSSFRQLGELGWGDVEKTIDAKVTTLDAFCREQGIETIDLLKSDTQGYDFEVLKGAEGLLSENRIKLIYFEFIFSNQYKDLPSFDEVYKFLTRHRYHLVALYGLHYQRDLPSWTDLLFISDEHYRKRAA